MDEIVMILTVTIIRIMIKGTADLWMNETEKAAMGIKEAEAVIEAGVIMVKWESMDLQIITVEAPVINVINQGEAGVDLVIDMVEGMVMEEEMAVNRMQPSQRKRGDAEIDAEIAIATTTVGAAGMEEREMGETKITAIIINDSKANNIRKKEMKQGCIRELDL